MLKHGRGVTSPLGLQVAGESEDFGDFMGLEVRLFEEVLHVKKRPNVGGHPGTDESKVGDVLAPIRHRWRPAFPPSATPSETTATAPPPVRAKSSRSVEPTPGKTV